MSVHGSHKPCADDEGGQGRLSSGNCGAERSGQASEKFFGAPFDLHRYRAVFPDLWMRFLHAHFRDHVHVAFMFGCNERTARNWWEGLGAPRPEYALAAVKHIPGAAQKLLEAA